MICACVWHVSFIFVLWPIHTWLMHHMYMCCMTHFTCVTWPIHVCDMTPAAFPQRELFRFRADELQESALLHVWHDFNMCVTWLVQLFCNESSFAFMRTSCRSQLFYMCDMTLSHVWHNSCGFSQTARDDSCTSPAWLTWLFYVCQLTPVALAHGGHDSFMCVTWLIHVCDMTPAAFRMCDMTHSCVWHESCSFPQTPRSDSWTSSTWKFNAEALQKSPTICDMTHPSLT